jgi:cytochrome c553
MLGNCLRYGGALAAALLLGLQPHGWAQPPASSTEGPVKRPAPAASSASSTEHSLGALGTRLVTQGLPDKGIAACANCHGVQGEGMAASGFPRLAGQSPAYLVRQIESFVEDSRSHPLMSPIAKAMTLEENMASAFYYASLDPDGGVAGTRPPASAAPASQASGPSTGTQAERGQRLARAGDEAAQIQACARCHGPSGAGEPPAYPYLAGQHASYLVNALNQWKSGQRRNDPGGQMRAVASRLSDADIAAVAAYYANMRPPSRRLASTLSGTTGANPPPSPQSPKPGHRR